MTKTSRIKPWSAAIIMTVFYVAVSGVSAITTKTSGTAVIKTKLQLIPQAVGETTTDGDLPSFAARYWEHQQDTSNGPRPTYDEYDSLQQQQPPHKLSAAQQTQILDDIRRHNQQQQQYQQPLWTERSPMVKARQATNGADSQSHQESAADQLQELLQINGVVDEPATDDDPDDDRQSKQRSIGFGGSSGGGSGGWQPQPQPPQMYNNQNRQQLQPSLTPFVPPPPAAISPPQQNVQPPPLQQQQQQKPQYYPTSTSATGPAVQQYPQQQRHQQQQQLFVTTPSSSAPTTAAANNNNYNHHYHRQNNQQQQYTVPQQYYPQLPTKPSSIGDPAGGEIDADIEQQIRQQLTAVVGSGGGNYTILTSLNGGASKIGSIADDSRSQLQSIASSASNDNMQYSHIGSPSSLRNRVSQQQPQLETGPTVGTSGNGHKNTIVKTVVIRQKPSPARQAAAAVQTTAASQVVTAASQQHQHTWTMSEQQQLEQLARQVLPPGVAQYEIIRAGGVDGSGSKGGGDVAAAATVSADNALPVGSSGVQQSVPAPVNGKKKPVTFVILEERPDGTVRVRGVEKKQHGTGLADGGGGTSAIDSGSAASADDEQLQQLVDKLNRGELRLPSAGPPKAVGGTDSVNSASTTAAVPIPAFAPTPSSPPMSNNGKHKHKPYYPTVTQQSTTTTTELQRTQFQNNYFLPTVPTVPTAAVPVATTTVGGVVQKKDHQHRHHQKQQQQHQYYSTPAITTSASSTPLPANSTMSYYNDSPNNNNHNNKNKTPKDGTFSSALRRRGYYAMAKYMRQAGIDTVLEDTGPFTVFVPTDKAFRALLVQLGGPDRAEDKFRENPRLLIGLLLHHVVPGAFKVADLKAGDEMTGVSLAGTQLRANLYARQLYDNRWNDIEVLTINGARVLDDVVPEAMSEADDNPSYDDNANGPVQQRRDMVLSSNGGGAGGERGNQKIIAIGHAVDRVLFPLPVGDILATMRADRQRRYNVFLRAVDEYCSPSVRALLTGSRTVTVFAPVDDAFRVRRGSGNYSSSGSIVDGLLRDDGGGRSGKRYRRRIADRFVLSHVVLAGPGDPPMYTAGLRFYQVRDTAYRVPDENSAAVEDDEESAADGSDGDGGNLTLPPADGENVRYYQLTVYKDSGRIRLNGGAAQVLVRNVPATNGVLHGLDAPLV